MAYYITEECISCGACEPECPNQAISEGTTSGKVARSAPRRRASAGELFAKRIKKVLAMAEKSVGKEFGELAIESEKSGRSFSGSVQGGITKWSGSME
jgi:ferredoxin